MSSCYITCSCTFAKNDWNDLWGIGPFTPAVEWNEKMKAVVRLVKYAVVGDVVMTQVVNVVVAFAGYDSDVAVVDVGMIQMLMSLETGLRISDHGDTVIVSVLAFRLEPDASLPPGLLTVDGECVDYGPIQAQVLPSMARVMSIRRGNDGWAHRQA